MWHDRSYDLTDLELKERESHFTKRTWERFLVFQILVWKNTAHGVYGSKFTCQPWIICLGSPGSHCTGTHNSNRKLIFSVYLMLTENNAFLQVVVGNVFKYQGPICYQMLNGLHPARNTHALQAQAWKHTCICRLLLLFYTICITTQTHDPKKSSLWMKKMI